MQCNQKSVFCDLLWTYHHCPSSYQFFSNFDHRDPRPDNPASDLYNFSAVPQLCLNSPNFHSWGREALSKEQVDKMNGGKVPFLP